MSNGILQDAHHFVLNNSQLMDHVEVNQTIVVSGEKGSGLKILLNASMRDAFHDSSARSDPPLCHPGTRQNFIDDVTSWALGSSQHAERMLWMHGPAGVGKSAVAQSCAELLVSQNKLGAALFFSRPNEWNKPDRLFTSISYQIATKSGPYGELLDHLIRKDPTLVTKSVKEQFQDLFVKPLHQLRVNGVDVEGRAIIIDGLDECEGLGAQCEIVEIIASSVREETTPFRWIFLSRPEPHIVGTFTANNICSLSRHLELPVSRKIDNEITLYLTDELRKIQGRSGLPDSWPSEREIGTLVNLAAGLFIYAATVIRFIGDHNSPGPIDQLRAVLSLAKGGRGTTDSEHPLSKLDLFYTLIMRCVPSRILPRVQRILLFKSIGEVPRVVLNVLGLSEAQYRNACGSLYSILHLDSFLDIKFYHASFMDFLQDPKRSKEFYIHSCLDDLRRELLERLNTVHSRSTGGFSNAIVGIDVTWPASENTTESWVYQHVVRTFFRLCVLPRPLDVLTSKALLNFGFHVIPSLWENGDSQIPDWLFSPEGFRKNVPQEFRRQIIRRTYNPIVYLRKPKGASWHDFYVLGWGKNRVVCWWNDYHAAWNLVPYLAFSRVL